MMKIIALHTGRTARADSALYTLALCDDGSLWRYVADGTGNPWRAVPLPPGCGSLPAAVKRGASSGTLTAATPVVRLAGGGNT